MLAARVRELGAREAKIEIMADGRVEIRVEDRGGILVSAVRCDVDSDLGVTPSVAMERIYKL